jgi:N-acetylmuramoyl-L-alanine amidase
MAIYFTTLKRPARSSGPTKRSKINIGITFLPLLLLVGCESTPQKANIPVAPVAMVERADDEMIVAGQRFHTGTRIVTWQDNRGLNAYHFQPSKLAGTENQGVRRVATPDTDDSWIISNESWDLAHLQNHVDQFVLHYDSEGLSRRTFAILQKRGLSSHFLLDVDGTIYQTLDLRDRAYHATLANSRSIGIEIANIGAYPPGESQALNAWYEIDATGQIIAKPSPKSESGDVLTKDFIARPVRPDPVMGIINGQRVIQYDFTPEQYAALSKLTAALHQVFPLIKLDYPRDDKGRFLFKKLSDSGLENFQGVLGHFHIQENKVDPGPAFQWDRLIDSARLLGE